MESYNFSSSFPQKKKCIYTCCGIWVESLLSESVFIETGYICSFVTIKKNTLQLSRDPDEDWTLIVILLAHSG